METSAPQKKTVLPIVPPKPKRKKPDTNAQSFVSKPPENSTTTGMKERENEDKTAEEKSAMSLTKTSGTKAQTNAKEAPETRLKKNAEKPALERKKSDNVPTEEEKGRWENALQELKEKISDRKVQKTEARQPRAGLKNEEKISAKTKHEISTNLRDELRAAQAESKTRNFSENASNSGMIRSTADFGFEENACDGINTKIPQVKHRDTNSPSWVEERKLWEKAVNEMELIISNKDLVIDNLSQVNRKLSEDIEYYEDTLRDWKGGDDKQYQRIIAERDEKIQVLEVTIIGDREGYQKIMDQRETQIRELESKVHELRQSHETKDRNSLELSHGSQNVLKTLGLKREKLELEKRVEELQERLQFYESVSQNQADLQESDKGGKELQEIPSLLYRFREGMETQLQENAKVVGVLEEKLLKCVENCEMLTKLNRNNSKHVFEDEIGKQTYQQVQSTPDLEETNFRDSTLGRLLPDLTQQHISLPDFSESSNLHGITEYVENIRNLEEELQKEKLINENLMEKFIEQEELNNQYQDSIRSLESKVKDVEDLRVENENLREENEELVDKISEMKESNDDDNSALRRERSDFESQEREIIKLQEKLVEEEALIKELREKVVEDEELIEELRANCQREEKWNREMQRNYEWEVSTSAKKDDCIEEFQDCLWAREKLVRELQQQLDFEDKRCEELLEKLIVSQKEAEEFQEMSKDSRKKMEDSENRIKEFCDQNDRDVVTIGNLTSENKQLRMEVDGLVKMKRSLEEDLERANGCLEAVEADKENFFTRQERKVNKLSVELEDKEYTNQGKDEVSKISRKNNLIYQSSINR